jgi:hypothetical protein
MEAKLEKARSIQSYQERKAKTIFASQASILIGSREMWRVYNKTGNGDSPQARQRNLFERIKILFGCVPKLSLQNHKLPGMGNGEGLLSRQNRNMITYQVFKGNSLLSDHATVEDLSKYLTAGSKLAFGNRTKTARNPQGKFEDIKEIRAVYKLREGGYVTIIQNT